MFLQQHPNFNKLSLQSVTRASVTSTGRHAHLHSVDVVVRHLALVQTAHGHQQVRQPVLEELLRERLAFRLRDIQQVLQSPVLQQARARHNTWHECNQSSPRAGGMILTRVRSNRLRRHNLLTTLRAHLPGSFLGSGRNRCRHAESGHTARGTAACAVTS